MFGVIQKLGFFLKINTYFGVLFNILSLFTFICTLYLKMYFRDQCRYFMFVLNRFILLFGNTKGNSDLQFGNFYVEIGKMYL